MRRAGTAVVVLILAVLHTPINAQAVMASYLPDVLRFETTAPLSLLVTGIGLLWLGRAGKKADDPVA